MWHRGLLFKLKQAGVSDPLIKWSESYLSDRFQRVVLEGGVSDFKKVLAGVPQGSILGPIMFLIYINDIVNDIGSCIRLFADDTSLYLIVDDPNVSADLMNNDLDKIHTWSQKWLVTFNPNKTEELLLINLFTPPPLNHEQCENSKRNQSLALRTYSKQNLHLARSYFRHIIQSMETYQCIQISYVQIR